MSTESKHARPPSFSGNQRLGLLEGFGGACAPYPSLGYSLISEKTSDEPRHISSILRELFSGVHEAEAIPVTTQEGQEESYQGHVKCEQTQFPLQTEFTRSGD